MPTPNFYGTKKTFQTLGIGRKLFSVGCKPVYEIHPSIEKKDKKFCPDFCDFIRISQTQSAHSRMEDINP